LISAAAGFAGGSATAWAKAGEARPATIDKAARQTTIQAAVPFTPPIPLRIVRSS
jgi:hypothetical protein